MGLRLVKQIVVHDKDGAASPAHLAECEECGGCEFVLYTIHGSHGDHQHVQCIRCGTSYCDNSCQE